MRILDILLLVGAILTLYRLYRILGQRTQKGESRKRERRNFSFSIPGKRQKKEANAYHDEQKESSANAQYNPLSVNDQFPEEHAEGLRAIAKIHKETFSLSRFLLGTVKVYDMILKSINQREGQFIKHFSTGEARKHFDSLVNHDIAPGNVSHLEVIKMNEPKVRGAYIQNAVASIDVLLGCSYLSFVEDSNGNVVAGSKTRQAKTSDIWTFAKNIKKPKGIWHITTIKPAV